MILNKTSKIYILLHLLLMLFSLNGILSKMASQEDFLSLKWCLLYGGVLLLLGIYAIGWQQIIKRMPLMSAYANKAVITMWGLVWGVMFFKEKVTVGKVAGIIMIVAGVVLFALSDKSEGEEERK